TIGPGSVGNAGSTGPRVTREPYLPRSPRMVAAVMPLTMVSFRLILKASTASDVLLVGANTRPSVALVDFSGFRSGLPPLMVVNCVEQSVRLPVTGQRSGSLVPAGVTLLVTGR